MIYSISEIKKAIHSAVKILYNLNFNIPLLINGPTGLGKTSMIQQVANELGVEVIDLKLGFIPEAIAGGIPQVSEKGFKLVPIEQIQKASETPAILFLDEITLAGNFNIALSLIFGRQILGYQLHPRTYVLSACNYGASYDTNILSDAVRGRFCILNATYSKDNIEYLVEKYKNDRIAYLSDYLVTQMRESDNNDTLEPLLNPRTIEYACVIEEAKAKGIIDEQSYLILLSGVFPKETLKKYLDVPEEYILIKRVARGEKVKVEDWNTFLTRLEEMFPTFESYEKVNTIKSLVELDIPMDVLAGSLKKLIGKLTNDEKKELFFDPKFRNLKEIISKFMS